MEGTLRTSVTKHHAMNITYGVGGSGGTPLPIVHFGISKQFY